MLQGIEFYRDGVILYSLGNFIFDLKRPATRETVGAAFEMSGTRIIRITLTPCRISDCRPIALTGDEKVSALRSLLRYSEPLATETVN